jgi:hypothetical protein
MQCEDDVGLKNYLSIPIKRNLLFTESNKVDVPLEPSVRVLNTVLRNTGSVKCLGVILNANFERASETKDQ